MRYFLAAGAACFVALAAFFTILNMRELPPGELARRCAACAPAWDGYQEEIKAIGARPVARWRGEPVWMAAGPGGVRLAMSLSPPWDAYEAALPLLLREPGGQVFRNSGVEAEGPFRVYVFPPVTEPGAPDPVWLEIQYPHVKRRLHLDGDGRWRAAPGS